MDKGSRKTKGNALRSLVLLACFAAATALLAGCSPAYNRPGPYGYNAPPPGYQQCYQGCGYVREVREVPLNNGGATIGTVIGAVVGGLIGNQVGAGRGRTAATVAGAVGGGFAGHAIGERSGEHDGWQVVVQLNNGQYATVTQRNPPQVRIGDYVMIRNNEVVRF